MADWTDVAPVGEIAPGDYRVVDIDDALIAVFNVDGEFYAIEDVCTCELARYTALRTSSGPSLTLATSRT